MRKGKNKAADNHGVTHTSDDVLTDLGINLSDADRLKLHIAMAINSTIQEQELTQVEAARILKIDQPKVSAILKGRLDGFSEDRLMGFLFTLGRDMEVHFPERRSSERGQLRVRA